MGRLAGSDGPDNIQFISYTDYSGGGSCAVSGRPGYLRREVRPVLRSGLSLVAVGVLITTALTDLVVSLMMAKVRPFA